MKKFMVMYHAPALADWSKASPEQQAEGIKLWMDWQTSMGDKLTDFGAQMMGAHRLSSDGNSVQTPTEVIGYSIIQASNLDEAKSLLKTHPHLKWNSKAAIEYYECLDAPSC